MENLSDYFAMGGYARFVWPAYALGAAGLVAVLWLSVKSWKAREDEFAKLKTARDEGAN
ncbi:MAG: heme exporter protein CcmD [Rhodospirillaceae bacterium]|nr:heme exporter protein CcmD [Rhodospirillaceae bacterium]